MAKQPSPNDQRSNALNPNNTASKAADNRANQMNPEHPVHKASRGSNEALHGERISLSPLLPQERYVRRGKGANS